MFKLHPKIAAALATALTLNGGTLIAYLNGSLDGRGAVVACLTADIPVVAGYLKGVSPDA
jgi:hypothetical protein